MTILRSFRVLTLPAALLFIGAIAPACSDDAESTTAQNLDELVVATQTWQASKFNANVLKIIVEREKLGPSKVTLTEVDEYAQWEKISTGEIHVSLENWPSGHVDDIKKYIDPGLVTNAGTLGSQAKIGWYIPTSVVAKDPSLRTWEAYRDKAKAGLFKTATTGEKGRILLGDTTWVSNEKSIISNLGLELEVGYAGGEQPLLDEIDNAFSKQAPIMVQLWIPHAYLTKYDWTPVELKPYTPACVADPAKIDCDYPPDALFKTAWSNLKTRSPKVFKVVSSMQLSTKDQIDFLRAISVDKKTIEQASLDWVNANESTWRTWL